MTILNNRPGTIATVHLVANGTITIAGNSSVSNVAYQSANYSNASPISVDNYTETVVGAKIRKIVGGAESGASWVLKRGSNVVFVASQAFVYDLGALNMIIGQDSAATLVANLNGGGNGFIMIEISKDVTN